MPKFNPDNFFCYFCFTIVVPPSRMLKYIFVLLSYILVVDCLQAQVSPSPAPSQSRPVVLKGGIVHYGDGRKEKQQDLCFEKGKITVLSNSVMPPANSEIIDIQGKHIYPGFISLNSDIGLEEVESVRATLDSRETGGNNPNARALIAYNTDSKITPTIRCNGVLMAQIAPKGGTFSGSSSVVHLDAWHYEDAVLKTDDAVYLNWFDMQPPLSAKPEVLSEWKENQQKMLNELHDWVKQAQAYQALPAKDRKHNLLLEALGEAISGKKKLFVRAESEKQIVAAVAFALQHKLKIVIVGGQESYLQTALLKKHEIPVVLYKPHQLPRLEDDPVDLPYKLPRLLEEAGIKYAYDMDVFWNERNLPYQAGTAAAYGLDKEAALKALAYYPAQILGLEEQVGTIEVGKDATLIVTEGDALDIKASNLLFAFIQGRKIDLGNLHLDLYQKFKQRYE